MLKIIEFKCHLFKLIMNYGKELINKMVSEYFHCPKQVGQLAYNIFMIPNYND